MSRSLRKAYEITDAKIQFVSLVDKAANKRQFLIKKEDGGKATFTTYGRIIRRTQTATTSPGLSMSRWRRTATAIL